MQVDSRTMSRSLDVTSPAPPGRSRLRRIERFFIVAFRSAKVCFWRSFAERKTTLIFGSILRPILCVIALVLAAQFACADETRRQSIELFEKQIRPVLINECLRCHGEKKQQGHLRLDSQAGWMTGGDSGPAIVAGDDASLLLQVIRYEHSDFQMPPRGQLPRETVAAFERWVELGAIDPRSDSPSEPAMETQMSPSVDAGKSFWSFQKIVDPPLPSLQESDWPSNTIDQFILATLEQKSLKHSIDADPATLLRRVYYDLIGLPPTPQQIESFLSDPSPLAYEKLVSTLLNSEQFGQRWGRHWLDVVRYAESSGGGRTLLFPDAWRYRDYVIESFNNDLPYDQFVVQQIAGDLLPTDDWQQRRRNLIATAFLLLGPTNYELQDKDVLEMDVVDEQLDTMGKAMLGMTLGCARCHDHKFDPIPATDYYAMAGILKSSRSLKHANVSEWSKVSLPPSPEELARSEAAKEKLTTVNAELESARREWLEAGGVPDPKTGEKSIAPESIVAEVIIDDPQAERIGSWTESMSVGIFVGKNYLFEAGIGGAENQVVYRPKFKEKGRFEVRASYTASANRTTKAPFHIHHAGGTETVIVDQRAKPPIDGKFISLGHFDFDPEVNPRVVVSCEDTDDGCVIADAVIFLASNVTAQPSPQPDIERLAQLKQQVVRLEKRVSKITQSIPQPVLAMAIVDQEQPADIHLAIRGATHQKGDLTHRGALQVASWESFPAITEGQSGRKELADWIVDPRNPLTARVMVNRVWYWLFGRGIVPTVDNFGAMGELPSDPRLLDHLASSFVRENWSVKRLIQRIVTSRTYRQSSAINPDSMAIDSDNRYLSRMNRKRLRAEDIRDSLLFVGGELDVRHGGSNIKPGTSREYGYSFDSVRRSVYVPVFRNTLPEIFEVFDFADPNIQHGKRSSSTVSSQALLMMNHPFVIDQATKAAEKSLSLEDLDVVGRIDLAYRQIVGRPPSKVETEIALDLIAASDNNDLRQLALLYQVLFQCVDFRYLN